VDGFVAGDVADNDRVALNRHSDVEASTYTLKDSTTIRTP
jgi:hypothetical protein